jgi:predicted  nucleic acid-binding Zn-ribbon protein
VHCGKLYPDAAKELLTGCNSCGSHFFYFIKKEYYDKLNSQINAEVNKSLSKEMAPIQNKPLADIQPKAKLETFDKGFNEFQRKLNELNKLDKEKIEKDVRDIIGISEKEDAPVILDLESIRILEPGKFEIDVVNLFSKKRPLIYKLEEGKYIIDLASTLKLNAEEVRELGKKIKDPDNKKRK